MSGLEQAITQFISNVFTAIQWPGVLVLMAIESACIPIPSEIIMPLTGWLLVRNAGLPLADVLLAGAVGAFGCLIGSVAAYYIGWSGGRALLLRYGKYILINPKHIEQAERWFERNGTWTIFLSRLMPVVRTFISLPAGIARVKMWKFIPLTLVGSFIWCSALAWGGYVLGEKWEEIRSAMRPFDPIIAAAIIALIIWYFVKQVRDIRANGRNSVPKE